MKVLFGILMLLSVLVGVTETQAACPMNGPIVTDFVAHDHFGPSGGWVIDVLIVRGPNTFSSTAATIDVLSVKNLVVTHLGRGTNPPLLLTAYVDHAGCQVAHFTTNIDSITGVQDANPHIPLNPVWCALASQPGCATRAPELAGVALLDDTLQGSDNEGFPVGDTSTGSWTERVGFCSFVEC